MVKAAGEGDFCNAVGGTAQEIAADLQAVSVEKGDGRLPHIPTEDRAAFAAAHISCCGNVVQCELLRVMTINIGNHFSLGGEIAGFFSGSGGMLWGQKRKRVCKQADQQPDHFQFPAGSLFAVKRCGSFQDICTFIPVRCAGGNMEIVCRTVFQEGLQIFLGQAPVLGDQIRMEKNADKMAVVFPPDGIAVVHLAGRHHQAVAGAECDALSVDVVIHGSLEDMDPLQVIVPVAERPSVRITGQMGGSDIEGNTRPVVVYDFRISFHNRCLYHV